VQEEFFGDFWADQAPRLQQMGWVLRLRPASPTRACR
jgi:hypothetical protein